MALMGGHMCATMGTGNPMQTTDLFAVWYVAARVMDLARQGIFMVSLLYNQSLWSA
jgi:hypothetical protein